MELMNELLGHWGGVLALFIVLFSIVAIPLGVTWALVREVKGPMERYGKSGKPPAVEASAK